MKRSKIKLRYWQKFLKNKWLTGGVLAFIILGVGLFIQSLMVTPQVAEIGSDAMMRRCTSNVASISFQQQCGASSFRASSFKCLNSNLNLGNVYQDCRSYTDIMTEAQKVCGQTCIAPSMIPQPTRPPAPTPVSSLPPYPTYSPTPFPTSKPSPSLFPTPTPIPTQSGISCNVKVYKLKATDDLKANPKLYATSDRLIDPSQTRVMAGESYALLVDTVSNNLSVTASTVSAVTSNVAGSEEPIQVVSTTPYCSSTDSWGKYMGCTHPGVSYVPGVTQNLDIGMTIQIQDSIYGLAKTSIRFGLYNILESGTGYSSECYATMMASESVSTPKPTPTPIPTPTPTPMPPVGCYYEKSTCFSGFFGGDCRLLLQCPTPIPTLMPTPLASGISSTVAPTMRPTPTPLPIAPEGCYYERRFCISSVFGRSCAPALYCPKPPKPPFNVCMKECRANTTYARCFRSCVAR